MAEQAGVQRDPIKRLQDWFERNRRAITITAVAVVVAAGGAWFYMSAQQRKESFAQSALEDARTASQAGNLALAASDLSRMIERYDGTRAADQATILLAQIRLFQDDPAGAAQELRRALAGGIRSEFQAPAYSMLGSALENLGNQQDAGEAFLEAARASWYKFLAAQYLNDAGRAFAAAGDTARAIQAFQRILDEHEDAPSATEARVRLAELRATQEAIGG